MPSPRGLGIGYTSLLKTLDADTERGDYAGKKRNIGGVSIKIEKSGMFQVAGPAGKFYNVKGTRFTERGNPVARTTELFEAVSGDWDKQARMQVRQTEPVPLTILTLAPEIEAGG